MSPSRELDRLPSPEELVAAAGRLHGRVHRTPLLRCRSLGKRSGVHVFLKCENLQRTGSFKIRGALNASLEAREGNLLGHAGVLTYSSGNHGQAVALAARLLGVPATVVVPEDIPEIKRQAIEEYGARVIVCGLTSNDRYHEALRRRDETGAYIVHPFNHPHTIAGQSTVGREILEDLPEVDAVLVPVGGGGLIAGVALAKAASKPAVDVLGVEPETANAMALSLDAGKIVQLTKPPTTIADGLRPLAPGHLTFRVARQHVARVLLVDDTSIRQAQQFLLERAKLVVEPSGAAAAAALMRHPEGFQDRTVVVVLSGGNTDVRGVFG